MDINFWSHVYCTQSFLPLFKGVDNAYIINTASLAAIVSGGGMYGITKHAMAAYSETLMFELAQTEDYKDVQVLCLCPGFVGTNLGKNTSNVLNIDDPTLKQQAEMVDKWMCDNGMTTEQCVDYVFQAIEKGEFWIFPHTKAAHYFGMRRYQSWITRRYDQTEFDKQIKPNFGKFHWEV